MQEATGTTSDKEAESEGLPTTGNGTTKEVEKDTAAAEETSCECKCIEVNTTGQSKTPHDDGSTCNGPSEWEDQRGTMTAKCFHMNIQIVFEFIGDPTKCRTGHDAKGKEWVTFENDDGTRGEKVEVEDKEWVEDNPVLAAREADGQNGNNYIDNPGVCMWENAGREGNAFYNRYFGMKNLRMYQSLKLRAWCRGSSGKTMTLEMNSITGVKETPEGPQKLNCGGFRVTSYSNAGICSDGKIRGRGLVLPLLPCSDEDN